MEEIPEWVWWLLGMCLGVISALVGVIYWSLKAEDQRMARNIHGLRTIVQRVVLSLAAKGIIVRTLDDE